MRLSHSGDIGDLIYGLRVVMEMPYGPHRFYFRNRSHPVYRLNSPMTVQRFEYLKPMVVKQPYIMSVWYDPYYNTDDISLDNFRNYVGLGYNLIECHARAVKIHVDTSKVKPWLFGFQKREVAPIVIARSLRHQNKDFPWDYLCTKYLWGRSGVFVGTEEEHRAFQSLTPVQIPYYPTPSIIDLLEVINGCTTFIGNQSAPRAIAEALGKKIIVESYAPMPNTDFKRPGAAYLHNSEEAISKDLTEFLP